MAYTGKRKRGGRSTAGQGKRKRPTYRKRTMRVPRQVSPKNSLTVRRMCVLGTSAEPYLRFSTTNTGSFWQFVTPTLNDAITNFAPGGSMGGLSNILEYSALFDVFKLNAVKFTFRPQFIDINASYPFTAGNIFNPPLVCILKDPMNSVVPTGTWGPGSLNILLEGGGKIYRADKPFSVYLKPKIAEQYGVGAQRFVKPQWTDLNAGSGVNMAHRGFHMYAFNEGWDATNLSSHHRLHVTVTYYLQFKNPK